MGMNGEPEQGERELAARRELFAVLAHEFRSPIGAILGFEELLSEGIFGEVPTGGRDALARIRNAAHQLLDLVAGLNDLSGGRDEEPLLQHASTDLQALLTAAVGATRQEAAGRNTTVELGVAPDLPVIETDAERVQRALRLALMAAIKSAAGNTVRLCAAAGPELIQFDFEGTGLELGRDEPDQSLNSPDGPRLTGSGLRIAMARDALAPLHGQVSLVPAAGNVTLRILLPSRPAAPAD